MLAGKGAGIYPVLRDAARRLVRIEAEYLPNEKNRDVYRAARDTWREVYRAQLALSDAGVTRYMWAAPGL